MAGRPTSQKRRENLEAAPRFPAILPTVRDPDTAQSLNNLAILLQAQGDFDGAHPLFKRALAIREKALGPHHPSTATSLNDLAFLLQAQGDLEEAELCSSAL